MTVKAKSQQRLTGQNLRVHQLKPFLPQSEAILGGVCPRKLRALALYDFDEQNLQIALGFCRRQG